MTTMENTMEYKRFTSFKIPSYKKVCIKKPAVAEKKFSILQTPKKLAMLNCLEICGGKSSFTPRTPACFGVHRAGLFKFLAIVNGLMNIIAWVLLIVDVVANLNFPNDARRACGEAIYYMHMIVWAWGLFHQCVQCTLDLLLYFRAGSTNAAFLRGYIIYTIASFPLLLLILVKVSYCKVLKTRVRHETRWLIPGYFVYKIYLCYVLNGYVKDIKWEKELKSGRRNLFHHEIYQFEEGMEASVGIQIGASELSCQERALLGKYKKEEFEIDKKALDFAEATMIGSGEFGFVYKLNLTTRKKDGKIPVAVKTIDSDLSDATCFKALLTEAKVMTYLGKHGNVVELIGLCTKDIRLRKLYIVLELCAFGSLHTYLISERATFSIETDTKASDDIEHLNPGSINESHLVRWCLEIARGMEYLASQKVVHGDLATRNVLLNENRTAKITDFGLSRRLYNYSVYVRRKNTPLPWRWLAVEALVDMKFSSTSDVWSYGICCWEIFELGKRPWCTYPQFTLDFISDIKNGVRLEKPSNCRQDFFDDILFPCWKNERSERPKFSQIVDAWTYITKNLESPKNT